MKKLIVFLISLLLVSPSLAGAQKLVGFGDSNTDGTNFNIYYQDKMAEKWIVLTNAVNAGVSGNTTEQARYRFNADVLERSPDVVTIMFGTNDAVLLPDGTPKVDKTVFESNLRYFVNELQARGIRPILMTTVPVIQSYYYTRHPEVLYVGKGGARLWHDSYNNITRKVAEQEGVRLIDNYANAVLKAGGATDYNFNQSGLIDPTGTHFAPRGHGMVSYSIHRVLGY